MTNEEIKLSALAAAMSSGKPGKSALAAKPQPPVPPAPPPRKDIPFPTQTSPNSPPPGWVFRQPVAMTPDQSRQYIATHVVDESKIYKGPAVHAQLASNTVEGPASIVELARALKNDPQLIFEYVYNNIEWEPNWGVQKGALGCLLDGSGNAFDQSMLLVALLRQAGFTANYALGNIRLSEAQYGAWFDTIHIYASYYYLNYANIPATFPSWNGTDYDVFMSHVWVQVVVNGTTYVLDPSYKQYNRPSAVSVGGTITAGDVLSVTVLDAALGGGSETVNYTVLVTDTLNTISEAISAAINADSSLAAIGVTSGSTVTPYPAQFTLSSRSANPTTYSVSTTFGATETLTFVPAATLLPSILNYSQSTFLSDAASGATVTTDYVQNMNSSNIATDLKTMTSNLVSYINNNNVAAASPGAATVDDVIGGRQIVPIVLPFTWLIALPYEEVGDVPTIWTGDVPLAYKTELEVQYYHFGEVIGTDPPDIDQTFTSDQLYGGRLTVTYDSGLHPVLTLNGTTVATGSTAGVSGQPGFIQLSVTHNAYSSGTTSAVMGGMYPGSYYLVGSAWGYTGRGALDYHSTLNQAAQASSTATNEEKIGEKLACIFYSLAAQNSRVADLVGRMQRTNMNFFHYCGLISYYIDPITSIPTAGTNIGLVFGFSSTLDYNFNAFQPANTVIAMHGVALEAAVLAQFNGKTPGVSTPTVIDKANRTSDITIAGTVTAGDVLTLSVHDTALSGGVHSVNYTVLAVDTLTTIAAALAAAANADATLNAIGVVAATNSPRILISSTSGNQTTYTASTSGGATETISIAWQKIYLGTSSNWSTGSNISSILSANGYSAADITTMGTNHIFGTSGDGPVLVGERPGLTLGDFVGQGYWLVFNYTSNGGAIGLIQTTSKGGEGQDGDGGNNGFSWPQGNAGKDLGGQPPTSEPIGLFSGDYFYLHTDLSLGSQGFPYGLTFGRAYNSRNQYVNGILGWGWTHNHAITANVGSDGLMAMGEEFARQGVATLTELYIALDLLNDSTQPITKLVTASLADKWWVDRLVNNTVIISNSSGNGVFILQPDGSYTAPARSPATLTLTSGTYSLKSPHGITFSFNSNGQLSTYVSPRGVTVSYTYSSGKLSTISNGLGRTLTLSYTGSNLTSVSDGTGRSIQYDFDTFGNLTSFTDALSNVITHQYDQPGRMTQVFLPNNPTLPVTTNVYDSLSRVQTQSNARSQSWTYYFAGARTEEVDPLGNAKVLYFNPFGQPSRAINPLSFTTKFVHDGLNRVTQITQSEGNKTRYSYDLNNKLLTTTFVPKPGSGLSNSELILTYDATWAKQNSYQDPNGNVTTYAYDPSTGNLLTVTKPTVGGLTPQTSYTYNGRGQVASTTDETGIVTQFNYDPMTETLTSIVFDYSAGAGHLNLTQLLGYDSVGNCTSITDPNTNQTTMAFDNERRLTQVTAPAPFNYVTSNIYDANGNRTSLKRQVTSTPTWQTVTFVCTVTDRVSTVTDPLGFVTTYTYDGLDRRQTLTDAQGRSYTYSFDAMNRISGVTDASGNVSDTETFTNNGLVQTRTDSKGNVTQYSYDGLDRLATITYPDTPATTEQISAYDSNGNVLTYVTRSGNSIVITYDSLNRMVTRSPAGQATITYGYDLASRLTSSSKPVISGDPSTGAFQYFFDTAGRFYQEQYPDSKTVTHILDANGNQTKTTWPDGYYVIRAFDQLNRVTNIYLNGSATSAATYSYDQLSRLMQLSYSNGASMQCSFALNNNLTQLVQSFVGSSNTYSLGYNNVHQRVETKITDNSYLWHPGSASLTTYGSADRVNRYPTVDGATFTYDANLNLTYDGTFTYSFDTENHLLSATSGSVTAGYLYDPSNRQAQKTVGSAKTRFIYDGSNLIATYDGSGTLIERYVFGSGVDDPLIKVTAGGTITFFHADFQGSIIALSSSSGSVTNKYSYGPFGESALLSGTAFGFTGQRYDAETGLYYYKARYYSPVLGRFLQNDPLKYQGGDFNLYSYVHNDPLNLTDPSGMSPTLKIGDTIQGPGPAGSTGNGLVTSYASQFDSIIPGANGPSNAATVNTGFNVSWANANHVDGELNSVVVTSTGANPQWEVWVSQDTLGNGPTHQIITVGDPTLPSTWTSIGFSAPAQLGIQLTLATGGPLWAMAAKAAFPLGGATGYVGNAASVPIFGTLGFPAQPLKYVTITPAQGLYYTQLFKQEMGYKIGGDYVFNELTNNCQIFANNALNAIAAATGQPIVTSSGSGYVQPSVS